MAAGAPPSEVRDPRLDGLRGLAIALVLLFHATRFGIEATPWQRAALELPALGWSGVDLFFVLSGFLITGILLRSRGSETYYSAFYARRSLRIFPLYYAVLIFWVVLAPRVAIESGGQLRPLGAPVADSFWYWTYLTNIGVIVRGGSTHLLDVTWSLAIEEHFYLLWPWVVRRTSDRRLLGVCGLLIAGALLLRVAAFAFGAPRDTAYMFTLCRFDTLATGAAIAVLAARPEGLRGLARIAPFAGIASLAALALLLAGLAATGVAGAVARSQTPWMQTAGFTLLCVGWGSLLVWLVTAPARSGVARFFELRPLGSLGRYSYAIYLLHLPIAVAVQQGLAGFYERHFVATQLAAIALTTAIAYALARVTWFVLEEPLLRQKRRFPYRFTAPADAS